MSVEGSVGGGPPPGDVLEDAVHTEDATTAPSGEQNGVDFPEPSTTTSPENNVQRTEGSTHEEYETEEGGIRTKVRTSVSERKEVSHTVHRKVYGPGTDMSNFDLPEFPEFSRTCPYPDNATIPGIPVVSRPSPVRLTREYGPSTSEERVITTVRLSDRNEQPQNVPVKVMSLRSKLPGSVGNLVSVQTYEDMKNHYENELGRLRSSRLDTNVTQDRETTKEILQRRIIILESDLRDSKHVSEMLSEDLQTLRKQYEAMVNRNLQTENNNRLLQQRLHELKSVNKKMQRDANERGQLLDRLREAYNRERGTQRILAAMEEEHTKLVRDYDVLRQTYNRKEQQIHEFSTERAELYRKLDILEYEKQQLERVLGRSKSASATRANGESRTSRGYTEFGSIRRIHNKASDQQREEGIYPAHPEVPTQSYSDNITQIVGDVGFKQVSVDEAQDTEAKPDEAETSPENDPKTETETEKGPDDTTDVERQSAKAQATQPPTEDPDKAGYGTDGTLNSGDAEENPLVVPEEYCRTTTQKTSRNESMDDELYTYSYVSNVADSRGQRSYRNSALRKNVTRRISGGGVPPPARLESREATYRRPAYRRRPLSAYGFNVPVQAAQEGDVYRSPLPPRSSTSVGRLHPGDYVPRSPEREYTRLHRIPVRRPQYGGHVSPDPFKYDNARHTKEEIAHLEFVISKLKREKRRLEKEFYAGQMGRSQTSELSDALTRIGLEIYDLQSRLAIMKTMR